jgi:hypothetical protein
MYSIFFLHFCAHVFTSYFITDQVYDLLRRSKMSYFVVIGWSFLITFLIGFAYKGIEAASVGHFVSLPQALTYNATGIILAINKTMSNLENPK